MLRSVNPKPIKALHPYTVLAVDTGLRTGWAIQPKDRDVESGVFAMMKRSEDGEHFAALRNFLNKAQKKYGKIDVLVYEEINPSIPRSKRQITLSAGFRASVLSWCEDKRCSSIGVAPGAWKKIFTGKGHATKAEVVSRCVDLGFLPFDPIEEDDAPSREDDVPLKKSLDRCDDNECDAIGILHSVPHLYRHKYVEKSWEQKENRRRAMDERLRDSVERGVR